MKTRITAIIAGLVAATALAAAQTPQGSAFTYQGRLTQNGEPANGTFDFYVHLYDAAVGGTPTNPVGLFASGVQVSEGLFTMPLDFGASVFDGTARWLNVQVRDSAGNGFYTTLSPRQPITPAPYALYALNGPWQQAGTAIHNTNAGFVGVNRSAPVNSAECFGVQAPAQSGYGGMYVSTEGAMAKPFYGYTTGTETAWTYLDGASGDWGLYNGGTRILVKDTGEVGIGTTAPAARLDVAAPGDKPAARFVNSQAANNHPTVNVSNNGTGSALQVDAGGAGPALTVSSSGMGPALCVAQGGIQVQGAGVNTPTPAFIHRATLSSMPNDWVTYVDHPLCNNQPDAILIVTRRFEAGESNSSLAPFAVYFEPNENKWVIWGDPDVGIEPGTKYNVLVVNP